MIVRYIGSRDKKFQTLYLLAAFLFELSPFLLTIYVGTAPPIRSQLVIPFVIAGNFLLLLELRPKGLYRFFAIAALIFGAHQLFVVNRLTYTDQVRYQSDVETAYQVIHDIEKINSSNKPVAFIGTKTFHIPAAGCRGEIIGISFFEYDMPIEPHYFGSSTRIVQFMQSIGININVSPREHFTPARQLAQTMPCWPIEGSIQETDDFCKRRFKRSNPCRLKTVG